MTISAWAGTISGHGLGRDQLDLGAAQQAGELVFRQGVRHRRHGRQDGAGIGAEHDAGGQGLALALAFLWRA